MGVGGWMSTLIEAGGTGEGIGRLTGEQDNICNLHKLKKNNKIKKCMCNST